AEDHVHPGRAADDLAAVLLRQAAADRDLHAGAGVLHRAQVPEVAVEAVVRVLADRARVEDDDICGTALGCALVPRILQQTGQALGVVHVHLAAVGSHLVSTILAHMSRLVARTTRSAPRPGPVRAGPGRARRRASGTVGSGDRGWGRGRRGPAAMRGPPPDH